MQVALKSKNFNTPEFLLSSKMALTSEINFFGDVGISKRNGSGADSWTPKYKVQL